VSASERRVWIEGIGLWAAHLPGWDIARAILRDEAGTPPAPAPRPVPALLPPNERRRAPDTVAVSQEVAHAACKAAGRDPRSLASVFASVHGDLAITHYMCETLASDPSLLSPTKFHNSVHNAAAGYWTIATGCMQPYTAVSAWHHTFAAGLLEALLQSTCNHDPVLYVAYDVEARGALATMAPSSGMLGAAVVLAPERTCSASWQVDWDSVSVAQAGGDGPHLRPGDNAMAACLPLLTALAREAPAQLALPLGTGLELHLRLLPLPQEPG